MRGTSRHTKERVGERMDILDLMLSDGAEEEKRGKELYDKIIAEEIDNGILNYLRSIRPQVGVQPKQVEE